MPQNRWEFRRTNKRETPGRTDSQRANTKNVTQIKCHRHDGVASEIGRSAAAAMAVAMAVAVAAGKEQFDLRNWHFDGMREIRSS